MGPILERIKSGGGIKLPKQIMKSLHLKVGEEVELKVRNRGVLIKPRRSIVDEMAGAIELDQETAEEIIEDKELEMEMLED